MAYDLTEKRVSKVALSGWGTRWEGKTGYSYPSFILITKQILEDPQAEKFLPNIADVIQAAKDDPQFMKAVESYPASNSDVLEDNPDLFIEIENNAEAVRKRVREHLGDGFEQYVVPFLQSYLKATMPKSLAANHGAGLKFADFILWGCWR